jgi:hypothetical protein
VHFSPELAFALRTGQLADSPLGAPLTQSLEAATTHITYVDFPSSAYLAFRAYSCQRMAGSSKFHNFLSFVVD